MIVTVSINIEKENVEKNKNEVDSPPIEAEFDKVVVENEIKNKVKKLRTPTFSSTLTEFKDQTILKPEERATYPHPRDVHGKISNFKWFNP